MAAADVTALLVRPAAELAGLVRCGEVTSRELVEASLDRIATQGDQVNAFVDVYADDALAAADAIGPGDERPLAGVPVALKNNRGLEGKRLTLGAELFGDFIAPYDHNVTARLKGSGAVIVGSTTLPEFGILPTTETRRFGPTRNPWDLDRTPGGSSGGSGAAVAAGFVPIAHGNDGGGSTRIPAACCGLVGLKPQRDRISCAPELGTSFLTQDGVLSRTVADTALALDVLAGSVPGDASWAPPPAEPYAVSAAREPGRLRVALTTLTPLPDTPVDPVNAQVVHDTGVLLEELGHDVVEADPPWRQEGIMHLFTAAFGPAICTQILWAQMIAGREATAADMEPLSWAIHSLCKTIDSTSALGAQFQLHGFARRLIQWMGDYDVLVTPALAEPPVRIGEVDGNDPTDPMETFARSGRFTPWTAVGNVTGQPAIALPIGFRDDLGLPVPVQIFSHPAREDVLLSLATQIEAARPWAHRLSPVALGG